jgi:hypothetical protein
MTRAGALLAALAIAASDGSAEAAGPEPRAVASAVDRGIHALGALQRPSGGFDLCYDTTAPTCDPESTSFVPALVAASLRDTERPEARRIADRAQRFVAAQREADGWWRFWAADDPRHDQAPTDTDDTACAAGLLPTRDGAVSWEALKRVRAKDESFPTWSRPQSLLPAHRRYVDKLLGQGLGRRTADGNDVDCAVNANVLWMAARQGLDFRSLCDGLNRQVSEDTLGRCSLYYVRPGYVSYFFARAYGAGAHCLEPSRRALTQALLAGRKPKDDELATASVLAALQWLKYQGPEIEEAAESLLASQRSDGSWPARAFIRAAHGSPAVTTAIAVQALARYTPAAR